MWTCPKITITCTLSSQPDANSMVSLTHAYKTFLILLGFSFFNQAFPILNMHYVSFVASSKSNSISKCFNNAGNKVTYTIHTKGIKPGRSKQTSENYRYRKGFTDFHSVCSHFFCCNENFIPYTFPSWLL